MGKFRSLAALARKYSLMSYRNDAWFRFVLFFFRTNLARANFQVPLSYGGWGEGGVDGCIAPIRLTHGPPWYAASHQSSPTIMKTDRHLCAVLYFQYVKSLL